MLTRTEYEVWSLRESLQAGMGVLKEIEKSSDGLSNYGKGMLYAYEHVIASLDRILADEKEVSE